MGDKFKCKGMHFPKQEGDKWVCMYCDENVIRPNIPTQHMQHINNMGSICKFCIYVDFKDDLGFYCDKTKDVISGIITNCPFYNE